MERHPNRENAIGLYLRDHLDTGKVRIAENPSTLVIVFCIDDERGRLQRRLEVRQEVNRRSQRGRARAHSRRTAGDRENERGRHRVGRPIDGWRLGPCMQRTSSLGGVRCGEPCSTRLPSFISPTSHRDDRKRAASSSARRRGLAVRQDHRYGDTLLTRLARETAGGLGPG